jgi:mannose-1-phosphate guanylyltransferase / mannose-6-phosphate isomerase
MIEVTPVILCGGAGTRLWPLSRTGFPKQFLCLTGTESLFQQTVKRVCALGGAGILRSPPLIVANEEHRFLAAEQLREAGVELAAAILEPLGRNTAPALTLAALQAVEQAGRDPVLIVTPADHVIRDEFAFSTAMHSAIEEADSGCIAIFGIAPDRPETAYGYIDVGRESVRSTTGFLDVRRFVEKPDASTAERYLAEGGYFWNSGMFVLKASTWLNALESLKPELHQACCTAWRNRSSDAAFVRPNKADFCAIPADSIDYAVMERCPGSAFPMKMVRLDAGWSDVGSWDALWDVLPKDAEGNAHVGDVMLRNCSNSLVHATSRLVSLVGVSDVVVIETPDAVLVAHKGESQQVRHVVAALQAGRRDEQAVHRKVHRPWGWYDSIDEGGRFKVKHIQVKPKSSLSLQKHHHRAEHWVVVSGTAEITNGNAKILLTENQSTYIPLGAIHRLSNPGNIPLEIIEVQSGGYLCEDDIIRFEDNYGRDQK